MPNLGYNFDPARTAELAAQTRLADIESQRKSIDLQKQQMFMQQMMAPDQSGQQPTTDEISNNLMKYAGYASKSGLPQEAADLATKAMTLQKTDQDAMASRAKAAISDIDYRSRLLNGVHDQASWNQAVTQYESATGKMTGLLGTPYDPSVVRNLLNQGMTAKEKLTQDLNEQNSVKQDQMIQDRLKLIQAETNLANTRAANIKKAGGEDLKKGDIKYADDLIATDYPIMDDRERDMHARRMAERANEIHRQNPNVSMVEATNRAYVELDKAGEFKNSIKKLTEDQKAQKKLVEDWGATYDPNLEYQVINGQLMSRQR